MSPLLKNTSLALPGYLALLLSISFPCLAQNKGNIATFKNHPYANTSEGRDNYRLSGKTVNEARLYDFYQRQADFYMSSSNTVPEILPAYPGLDGGAHGHWGKHNQNNHSDKRWNDAEMGEVVTQVFRTKDFSVLKGICLRLGTDRELSACFDPLTLSYRAIWDEGFVTFDGFRWGTSRNAQMQGPPLFLQKDATMPKGGEYLGYYRYGKRFVASYQIKGVRILDEPWAVGEAFYRKIEFLDAASEIKISNPAGQGLETAIVQTAGTASSIINEESGVLVIKQAEPGSSLVIRISKADSEHDDKAALAHFTEKRKLEQRWTDKVKVTVKLGSERENSAYIVDTIPVPYDNPYQVVMQLSGLAFLENGDALACTLLGDVWRVSGFDDSSREVTWSRFATGFNQPVGIHVDEDGIFILDRGQIYRLHDTNEDGEVDYYENYANDFGGYDRSHTHTFGLHRTKDGAFHFTQRESILRTGSDQKTTLQGWGVRNCMGIGGSDDYFWVAPQEGTWTPTSAIIEVNSGEFYGLPAKDGKSGTIAAPLCFIPRGVDNSTGGMVEISSDQWGPFQGSHIGLSYGSGLHYLILRDATGSRHQGAVVPLQGEFLSGSMRGAFHPKDGQLYLVGLDGWGDYSVEDGCFHRVRYNGKPVHDPTGFQIYENGIRIDFATKLDPESTADPLRYFAHAWNYEYAKRYGSPEFSVRDPKSLGHDPVEIRSVVLLENKSSIFVEMPSLEPVMQHHIRMHLVAEDGKEFRTDLFSSPMYLGDHFTSEGLAKPGKNKPTAIALRVADPGKKSTANTESGKLTEGERTVVIDAIGGLQYAQKEIVAKAGEAIALKLRNTDVMPHNLVIVEPASAKKVGEASFRMLNDPDAGKKHYVPELPEVLYHIPVISPGTEHTLHFKAPNKPGDYPYICTFPGHWMAMNGILKVR